MGNSTTSHPKPPAGNVATSSSSRHTTHTPPALRHRSCSSQWPPVSLKYDRNTCEIPICRVANLFINSGPQHRSLPPPCKIPDIAKTSSANRVLSCVFVTHATKSMPCVKPRPRQKKCVITCQDGDDLSCVRRLAHGKARQTLSCVMHAAHDIQPNL